MRKLIILIPILLALYSKAAETSVKIHLYNFLPGQELRYSFAPYFIQGEVVNVKLDSTGIVGIKKDIESIQTFGFIYSSGPNYHYVKLILEPGCHYEIVSEGRPDSMYQGNGATYIYGCNSEAMNIFNEVDNGTSGDVFYKQWDLSKPEALLDTLQARISGKVERINALVFQEKLSGKMADIINNEIIQNLTYELAVTIRTYNSRPFQIKYEPDFYQKLFQVKSKLYELFPIDKNLLGYLTNNEAIIYEYSYHLKETNPNEFQQALDNGTKLEYELKQLQQISSAEVYPYLALKHIASNILGYESNCAKAFDLLLMEFPELSKNLYCQMLRITLLPTILDIEAMGMPPESVIIDKNEPITSLEQIFIKMEHKPILIHYWGSYCTPCISSFEYLNSEMPFFDEHEIKLVHIAHEKREDHSRWQNVIKNFKPKGYHVFDNDSLNADLVRHLGPLPHIPRYFLINENGKVVMDDKEFPDNTDKLERQMLRKLDRN